MGLLLDVIKTNALEDHPVLNLSHCVNRNQKHLTCSACMDIYMGHPFKDTISLQEAMQHSGGPLAFNLMIKPAGSLCNLDCQYCYYLDKDNAKNKIKIYAEAN